MNDLILAKLSGVSYVVGAVIAANMPPLQTIALIVAIVSGGLSIGDRLLKFLRSEKPSKSVKILVAAIAILSAAAVLLLCY